MNLAVAALTRDMLRDCGFPANVPNFHEVIGKCLRSLRIVSKDDNVLAFEEIEGWRIGGAETYVASAQVTFETPDGKVKKGKFMAKAPIGIGTPPTDVAKTWNSRRQRLARFGVHVPHLYCCHRGIIYEEYIPFSLHEIITDQSKRKWTIVELGKLAASLDFAGFKPIDILSNLRADGNAIYWVDFGSDLGGYSPDAAFGAKALVEKEISMSTKEAELLVQSYNERAKSLMAKTRRNLSNKPNK